LLAWLAQLIVSVVMGVSETPLQLAFSTALVSLVLLPSAWIGHGFAASVLDRLAPSEPS
ncbi:MAG: hypothetical protein HRT81_18140, partial [Henriciella sp.]|nr:hypothetical protein [Henriciella sp.]